MEALRRGPRQRSYTVINMSNNVTHIYPPTIIGVQNFSPSSAPYHTLFVFLIPLLVGVIEINNIQDKSKSLIETHSMSMYLFMLALIIYAFAYFAAMKLELQVFKVIAVISGSLCSISLVSIILPHSYGHFSFIILAFVLLVAYNKRFHMKIWQFWKRFGGNNQQLLPT